MKLLILPVIALSLVGCVPSEQTVVSGNAASINPEAPYIWANKNFPKEVRIASNFEPGEVSAIQEMALKWDESVNHRKNFFKFGTRTATTFNVNKPDGVMGIYKVTSWPRDFGASAQTALAVTQLFGRRYSTGTEQERVEVEHADIFVNYNDTGSYRDYTFDFDDTKARTGYDLRTVVLHEMGHFLGLNHIPTWYNRPEEEDDLNVAEYKATSVMYPSIESSEVKRDAQPKDVAVLSEKYISTIITPANRSTNTTEESDPGKNVRIIIELRANGECLHTENDQLIKRHRWKH